MSVSSMLDTSGALMRLTRLQAIDRRAQVARQRALRQERADHDNEEYNEAFHTFLRHRDNEINEDMRSHETVLQ
jgi:hypothetical protein